MQAWVRLIASTTGILLSSIAFLALLTGICLRLPGATSTITLGLLDYAACAELHLSTLPPLLAVIGYVHAAATADIIAHYASRGGGQAARLLANVYRILVYALGAFITSYTLMLSLLPG
ncbi:hypothetical protein Pyrfu_0311 [Pyrolobus fumarii 1A]|uniref:Uncharacterized protein n=1 Tax=Pyrolobus fumarii (strain DSM 11204 / 1A) TaxID=694429 RepID=G0EFE0_PYRF1|nr:hypothetical protein [Pyrolobus fumarii]AEM38183.1 hypothetical protein Pyrfu_0311 [Pyrolobus fumarii 1A]